MKKVIALAGIVSSLLLAPVANAALVTEWTYTQNTTWTSATFTNGSGEQNYLAANGYNANNHIDSTLISWGYRAPVFNSAPTSGSSGYTARSGVQIGNSVATGTVFTNGAYAVTNDITHYNNVLSNSFATLTGATLHTTLHLNPLAPTPSADDVDVGDVDYSITFKETANVQIANQTATQSCGFVSVTYCDDIFVITSDVLSSIFQYDGQWYSASLVEFTGNLRLLDNAQCAAAGAANGCFGFTTREGLNTTAQFGFDVRAIPEPTPMALLALGLFAFFAVSRRKNS